MGEKGGASNKKPSLKRGQLSAEEKAFVAHHKGRHTAEQIAGRLRRPLSTVRTFLGTLEPPDQREQKTLSLADELVTRPEWSNFREQFSEPELEHFKYRYVQLMGQFREEGILPTEEMQLYQVITLDILVQRTLKEKRQVQSDMDAAHAEVERLRASFEADGDRAVLEEARVSEMAYARASDQIKNLAARYDSYMMRQQKMLEALKATRDQRVKVLENSKTSFLGYLRLLTDETQREAIGREAGMMAAASDAAAERLKTPHQYADGMTDQPLLTPEDVRDY